MSEYFPKTKYLGANAKIKLDFLIMQQKHI